MVTKPPTRIFFMDGNTISWVSVNHRESFVILPRPSVIPAVNFIGERLIFPGKRPAMFAHLLQGQGIQSAAGGGEKQGRHLLWDGVLSWTFSPRGPKNPMNKP